MPTGRPRRDPGQRCRTGRLTWAPATGQPPTSRSLGVVPAGRPIRSESNDIRRIKDALVAGGWHVEDFAAVPVDWGAVTFASRPREIVLPPAVGAVNGRARDPLAVGCRWYAALRPADLSAIATITGDRFFNHGRIGARIP